MCIRDSYKNFGLPLKFGMYENYGMNADKLKDLVMFYSSSEKKAVTFAEYVGRMKEDQKYIYYACGDSIEKIGKMPQIEMLLDQGYEVLYCTDDVDEFALKSLMKYDEKEFRSASDDDLGIEQSEEAKKESEAKNEENKDLMTAIKDALDGKVNAVKLSTRLKSHPVCFSTEGISLEMEKVLNAQPMGGDVKADKVLEINGSHPVFDALKKAYEDKNNDKLKKYANLLYDQAMLIEGMKMCIRDSLYGVPFDANSVAGYLDADHSDLILHPDLSTLQILPWRPQQGKVARILCDVKYPDGTNFEGDSRYILKEQMKKAEKLGYRFNVGAECEFFLFRLGENGEPTREPVDSAGYFDLAPFDRGENTRREIILTLEEMGFEIESSHHESARGQHEIEFKYSLSLIHI